MNSNDGKPTAPVQPIVHTDPVLQTAQLMSALLNFDESRKELQWLVRQYFPIGCRVLVDSRSEKISGVVADYSFPGFLAIRFENGNTWDKHITKISRV